MSTLKQLLASAALTLGLALTVAAVVTTIEPPVYANTAAPSCNSPATGAPVILGNDTLAVGDTLRVDLSSISDEDGMEDVRYSIQWLGEYDPETTFGLSFKITSDFDPNHPIFQDAPLLANALFYEYEIPWGAVGTRITALVGFEDDAGRQEWVSSVPTARVPGPLTGITLVDTSDQSDVSELDFDRYQVVELDNLASSTYAFRLGLAADAEVERIEWAYRAPRERTVYRSATTSPHSFDGYDEDDNMVGRALSAGDHDLQATAFSEGSELQLLIVNFRIVKPNTPPVGTPTISGTPQVGQVLTADTSGISDADGLDDAQYSYDWFADETDTLVGGSAYTVRSCDVGKVIKVRVEFEDDGKHYESLTSEPTAPVAAFAVSGITALDYAENGTTTVATYAVTGETTGTTTTWSLTGDDSDNFSISSSGVLTFGSSPDYESPTDSDTDNVYEVTVNASDGTNTESLDVTVTVTNVDEAPTLMLNQ